MLRVFNKADILPECQHGFLKGKSVATQLIEYLDILTDNYEHKKFTDVIYFDFEKAFDSVGHNLLLEKLQKAGKTGKFLEWIKSFLCDRTARVCVNKAFSPSFDIPAGVPQGSVLGPILFIFYISDLPKECETAEVFSHLFADDLKAASSSSEHLQLFINKLHEWCRRLLG